MSIHLFFMFYVFIILGFLAGFIDSIAGGGGLITIPAFSLMLEMGPQVVGTNKVAATFAAGVAFLVYFKKGHFRWKEAVVFSLFIGVGSFLGSQLSQFIPKESFKYFLIVTAPIVLWLIFNKKFWLHSQGGQAISAQKKNVLLMLSGVLVGIYDGIWGPGGGTFMLLALLFILKLPLMPAIAVSKFANLISALSSLGGYAITGVVDWKLGFSLAIPVSIGAFLGAQLASKQAEKIVRPVLLFIVILLILKTFFS